MSSAGRLVDSQLTRVMLRRRAWPSEQRTSMAPSMPCTHVRRALLTTLAETRWKSPRSLDASIDATACSCNKHQDTLSNFRMNDSRATLILVFP